MLSHSRPHYGSLPVIVSLSIILPDIDIAYTLG